MKFKLPKLAGGRPGRWTLPAVLLGVYLFLKLQGWNYGFRAMGLERQMEQMRPALSAIVLSEEMERSRRGYLDLFGRIGGLDIQGSRLLQRLSRNQPVSVTVERVEAGPQEIRIQGVLKPGVLPPEEVLSRWDRRMGEAWRDVQVQDLAQEDPIEGIWRFRLKAKRGADG